MSFSSIAALFSAMVILAFIPSVSVITVSARAASSGFIHGAFTSLGIVAGDIIFILLAIMGLSFLVETLGKQFVLIKYLGGAYLILLGIQLWRSKSKTMHTGAATDSSLLSSFMAGLLITLGDQKAILFYLGFFPAFVDLSRITYVDTGIIMVTAIVAVGGVKLGYALMANRARQFINNPVAIKRINIAAGAVLIGVGIFLVAST